MIKMTVLDYEIYANLNKGHRHIADFNDIDYAKDYAEKFARMHICNTMVVNKFTGEIVTEFVIKTSTEIVEVKP